MGCHTEARIGLFAAARGTTMPGIAGRQTATGTGPATGTTIRVSGWSASQLTGMNSYLLLTRMASRPRLRGKNVSRTRAGSFAVG